MAGPASPILKIGQGFGTWLIPIIIFGILGSVAIVSLAALACVCLSRERIPDQEPGATREIYRTPTLPYRGPPSDRPVDATIGRFITHSRSLHVPRNQAVNPHRLRPQFSSPELRNTSQPPPYAYRMAPIPTPYRNPRPHGQVYFNQRTDPRRTHPIHQRSQQLPPPPASVPIPIQSERCLSASSPSSYSSNCASIGGSVSVEAFSSPSTPSIFSQESLVPGQALSWVDFSQPRDSDLESSVQGALPTPSSHGELPAVSNLPDPYEVKKLPASRRIHRSGAGDLNGRFGHNNRRLIIVDNNLVSRDSEMSSDRLKAHGTMQAEVTRPLRSALERTVARTMAGATADEERMEVPVEQLSQAGCIRDRDAIFKVMCPDTGDLWRMPVIPGETLDRFASRVKEKTGGDVILFVDDEILANEEDWKATRGGGRIVAHLIR